MRGIGTFLVFGSMVVCLAQNAPAPPSEVDRALRDRVTKFFQLMQSGKYRQAEQYVAQDTKETYYNMQKPKYLKFEISKISYSERFTRAHVVVHCEREVINPVMGRVVMKVPQITDWKKVKGAWYWYVDPNAPVRTPVGVGKAPQAPAPAEGAHTGPAAKPPAPSVSDLARLVSADKAEVRLSSKTASDQVVVKNAMPGAVDLTLEVPQTPGLEVKLERAELGANQTRLVLFHYTPQPGAPKTVVVSVQVQPTGQTIPIRVSLEPPAQAPK
jgi:hypothetical protein